MRLEIVQTWKTMRSIPPVLEQCIETWRKQQNAVHRMFGDRQLWQWLGERLDRYPHAIQTGQNIIRTVDMFRYCYLLECGGLYVDVDFYRIRDHGELLSKYDGCVVLGTVAMPEDLAEHSLPNSWMYAAEPGHPFWLLTIGLAANRVYDPYIERATGPILLKDALTMYRSMASGDDLLAIPAVAQLVARTNVVVPRTLPKVVTLPPSVLYPLSWGYRENYRIINRFRCANYIDSALLDAVPTSEQTYAFTFWNHSWGPDPLDC